MMYDYNNTCNEQHTNNQNLSTLLGCSSTDQAVWCAPIIPLQRSLKCHPILYILGGTLWYEAIDQDAAYTPSFLLFGH